MYEIIDLQLNDLRLNLKNKNNNLNFYKTAKELLLVDTKHREWGARPLRRNIQDLVENPISELFINGKFKDLPGTVSVKGSKGEFKFSQVLKVNQKRKKSAKRQSQINWH